MSLSGKKVWIDIEEPKTAVMFNSLIKRFQNEGVELLITARDFDSTFQILDGFGLEHEKIGKHGGAQLYDKLQAYIDRLNDLLPIVKKFIPDYFITFSSVEGARISYGLQISSIGFNDEPRNEPVCKLIYPLLDNIITPRCIPKKMYGNFYTTSKKIIRYNGIDEIAWLSGYVPNPQILDKFNLKKGRYVIIRSEPSFASYFINKLKPEETIISQFFQPIYESFPDYKYFLLVRTEKQEQFLREKLKAHVNRENVLITRFLPNLIDLCFYGALIISGGGTVVRESSLLQVPSIEFFPGELAPQEHFLIKKGFPLEHIKEPKKIIKRSLEILSQKPEKRRFTPLFKEKIHHFENPNEICFNIVKKNLLN